MTTNNDITANNEIEDQNAIIGELIELSKYDVDGQKGGSAWILIDEDPDNEDVLGSQLIEYALPYDMFEQQKAKLALIQQSLPLATELTYREDMGGQKKTKTRATHIQYQTDTPDSPVKQLINQLTSPEARQHYTAKTPGISIMRGVLVMITKYQIDDNNKGASIWMILPPNPDNSNVIGCQIIKLKAAHELFGQQQARIQAKDYRYPCLVEIFYKPVMGARNKMTPKVLSLRPLFLQTDSKPEDKKPEDKKPEDQKPEDQKLENTQPDTIKPEPSPKTLFGKKAV